MGVVEVSHVVAVLVRVAAQLAPTLVVPLLEVVLVLSLDQKCLRIVWDTLARELANLRDMQRNRLSRIVLAPVLS